LLTASDRPWPKVVSHEVSLGGDQVRATIKVSSVYEVDIDFTYFKAPYTFNITKWSRRGQRRFLEVFHEFEKRDPEMFGVMNHADDGDSTYDGDSMQKVCCVVQGALDILTCLDKLIKSHQRDILDYAVEYRETDETHDTYSKYITLLTCHGIVHTNFMCGSKKFDKVEF